MRWLLASMIMLVVLHVACGKTAINMPGAGTGGGGGTANPLPGVSTGGGGGGTTEAVDGAAAGSTSSPDANTGGQGPLPDASPAGADAAAGGFATGADAAGDPAGRSSTVGGQPGTGGTSMGGRLTVAGTTSIIGGSGGSGGASSNTASGGIIGGSGGSSSNTASGGIIGGSGGSCAEVTACGGDVVGTWKVESQCLTFDGPADIGYLGLTCVPNVAAIKGSLKVTGTLTLGSDRKFKDATTTTGSEAWQMDKSCLILSGTKVRCESIGTVFEGALKSFGYETFACSDASSGGGCACAATINTDAENGRPGGMGILHNDAATRGTYKTNGNKLLIGDSLSYTYCVRGNEMTVSPIPVEMSATPYRGTIVLTRSAP